MTPKTKKIKAIGAGGIMGFLLDPLCRYLNFGDDFIEMTIIDGDDFEARNRQRQVVGEEGLGINKAQYAVQRLQPEFSKIHFRAKSEYLTKDNIISTIRENDIVMMGVDNHNTRKLVSDRCAELDNVVLISGGNDYTDGNVMIYIKKDGQEITRPLTALSKSIAKPEDKNPGEFTDQDRRGCQEEAVANPQLLITNHNVASWMLVCYYRWEQGTVDFEQIYTDIKTARARPSPEKFD